MVTGVNAIYDPVTGLVKMPDGRVIRSGHTIQPTTVSTVAELPEVIEGTVGCCETVTHYFIPVDLFADAFAEGMTAQAFYDSDRIHYAHHGKSALRHSDFTMKVIYDHAHGLVSAGLFPHSPFDAVKHSAFMETTEFQEWLEAEAERRNKQQP